MQRLRFAQVDMQWTEIVRFLILTNVTIFVVQEIFGLPYLLTFTFGLIPAQFFAGKVWQLFTYMFLHGGLGHIFFNMLALWMFGSVLEREWGPREFLKYYLLTGLGGGLCYALFNMGSPVPTVGASGAIYGLLAAYAVLYPNATIFVWFVIPMRAKWFALIFGGIELYLGVRGGGGIAHLAHLGGMVIGYLYLKRERLFGGLSRGWRDRAWQREERARRREVDQLLDKINRVGLDGLTPREQKRLQEASQILREHERR